MAAAVEISNISKSYGNVEVLINASLVVEDGPTTAASTTASTARSAGHSPSPPHYGRRDFGVDAGNGVGHVIKITQKQIRNES